MNETTQTTGACEGYCVKKKIPAVANRENRQETMAELEKPGRTIYVGGGAIKWGSWLQSNVPSGS